MGLKLGLKFGQKEKLNMFKRFGKNIVALAKSFSYEKTNNEQFIYFIIIDNIFRSYRSSSGLKIQLKQDYKNLR